MRCKICQTSVGCGCNLKDGMCTYCYNKSKEHLVVKQPDTSSSQTVATPINSTSLKNQPSGIVPTIIGGFNLLT